jgi:hypothetical protein
VRLKILQDLLECLHVPGRCTRCMKKTLYGTTSAALLALATLVIPATATPGAEAPEAAAEATRTAPAGLPASPEPKLASRTTEIPREEPEAVNLFTVDGLRPEVLRTALEAHERAVDRGLVKQPDILSVIDFSLPSTERRMWVLDLSDNSVLYHERVTHGKNSGANLTKSFSNVSMSLKSNIGLLTTAETYYGKNGYSLRLDGHEPGYNDLARERAIVVHGADYATEEFMNRIGRLGRSWGCPALDPAISREVIDTIKGGSVLFGYYPDREWLDASAFVAPADEAPTRIAS